MTETREKKRTDVQTNPWLTGMMDLLRCGALAALIALGVLAAAAGLISVGLIGNSREESVVIAACLIGGLVGGILAVRRRKWGALPTGIGVGGVLFLLLLTAAVFLYDTLPTVGSGAMIACACLCGGGLAGVLGSNPKKKRRK